MASKAKTAAAAAVKYHPFDDSKLRPIHTAIDSGQYKQGFKLLHAAILKHGPIPVLQTLLALCHAYTHAEADARALLKTLPPPGELDYTTFHTLLLVYRVLDDSAALVRCYDAAVAKDPKNEELALAHFHALARAHDYGRLQTAGMKLFTSFKQNKYLVWSALNLLLLRRDTPPNTVTPVAAGAAATPAAAAPAPAAGGDKLMQLLEMMLNRTYGAPSFPRTMSPEELLVLLRIYSRQLKFGECMRLLDSEAGAAFKEKDATEYLRIRAQLLRDWSASEPGVQRLAESNAVYSELVQLHHDDWFFLCEYISGEMSLAHKQQQPVQGDGADSDAAAVPHLSFDERVANLRTFLRELQAKCTRGSQAFKRGPFLAEVELAFQSWRPAQPAQSVAPNNDSDLKAAAEAALADFQSNGDMGALLRVLSYEERPVQPDDWESFSPAQVAAASKYLHVARLVDRQQRDAVLATDVLQSAVGVEPKRLATLYWCGQCSMTRKPGSRTRIIKHILAHAGGVDPESHELEQSIAKYFGHFGAKSCFFYDVLKYLHELDAPARARLADACAAVAGADAVAAGMAGLSVGQQGEKSEAASVKRYQLNIGVQQLNRYNASSGASHAVSLSAGTAALPASSSSSSVAAESVGKAMLDEFLATTKLSASLLRVQSERGLGDHYLVLFAHHYFSALLARTGGGIGGDKERGLLLDLICALELGLKHSPFNFQFKLWLIRLYAHPLVGALDRAQQIYKSLDIKQIQHDITSHLLLDEVLRFGHQLDALSMCGKIVAWHAAADREDVQTTELAYQRANYSKVIEFVEFRERRAASLALYSANVFLAHAGIAKLGLIVPPTPGSPAVAPDAANTKDITNVHAFLKKSREELQRKYPALVDQSSIDPLRSLVANNDYTIVTVWDGPGSPLNSVLNRPAPALYDSSFALPHGELLRMKDDESHTHHASRAQLLQLRFFRIGLELLWAMTEQNAPKLRADLALFAQTLSDMGLADLASTATETATPDVNVAVSFDTNQWRLAFLTMDCSASVVESAAHTSAFVETATGGAEDADRIGELSLRWSSVQRQMSVVTTMLDGLVADVSRRFYQSPAASAASDEERAVVHGDASALASSAPADPRALRDVATLAQWSVTWLCVGVQMWTAAIPTAKQLKKKQKKGTAAAAAGPSAEEAQLHECVLGVRLSLATLIKALRASVHSLQGLCSKLAARAKENSASASGATATASSAPLVPALTLLPYQPSLPALQSAENAALVHTVLHHIDSSHSITAGHLLRLFNSIDQPLQHMKIA